MEEKSVSVQELLTAIDYFEELKANLNPVKQKATEEQIRLKGYEQGIGAVIGLIDGRINGINQKVTEEEKKKEPAKKKKNKKQ